MFSLCLSLLPFFTKTKRHIKSIPGVSPPDDVFSGSPSPHPPYSYMLHSGTSGSHMLRCFPTGVGF